jgi:D-alanyl-D-alanine carboxypeptidase
VYHSQFLRALTLGIALGSAFAAALITTPVHAGASILVDADTGKVLRADNATYPWYPASVTKLMTLYTTLQAVKQGRSHLRHLVHGVAQRGRSSLRPRWDSPPARR